jgi:hypothetical protein
VKCGAGPFSPALGVAITAVMALELELDVRRPYRWVQGAFFAFWLCGWAAGENFAAREVVAGRGGVFLVFWLSLWTFGGVAVLGSLLGLMVSKVRVTSSGGELQITRFALGVGWTSTVRGVRHVRARADHVVSAELHDGRTRNLFRARDAETAEQAAREIAWGLDLERGTPPPRVPSWLETVELPNGHVILQPAERARAAWTVGFWFSAVVLPLSAVRLPEHRIVLAVFGGVAVVAAVFSTWRRKRWLLSPGLLVEQILWNGRVTRAVRLESPEVHVESSTDSDGDTHWKVEAHADGQRVVLAATLGDEDAVRELCRYVAAAVGDQNWK